MDEAHQAEAQKISLEASDLVDQVEAALDEYAQQSVMLETRMKVEDMARRYRELLGRLGEKDAFDLDRTLGRRVRDVQKMASSLPAPPEGAKVDRAVDTGFMETRPGTSSRQPVHPGDGARPANAPRYAVAGEVDAWCGPCDGQKSHIITAVVEGLPVQVVCQSCGSRHKYREGPARPKAAPAKAEPRRTVTVDPATEKRARERTALIDALRAAENPRPYSPKDRYRSGEIIEHPEHGRGKIENILPRSMLVRFAVGLKTLKLG